MYLTDSNVQNFCSKYVVLLFLFQITLIEYRTREKRIKISFRNWTSENRYEIVVWKRNKQEMAEKKAPLSHRQPIKINIEINARANG